MNSVDAYRESWTQASRPVQCLRPGMLVRTAKQKNRSALNGSRARCRDLLFLQGEVRQIGTEDELIEITQPFKIGSVHLEQGRRSSGRRSQFRGWTIKETTF